MFIILQFTAGKTAPPGLSLITRKRQIINIYSTADFTKRQDMALWWVMAIPHRNKCIILHFTIKCSGKALFASEKCSERGLASNSARILTISQTPCRSSVYFKKLYGSSLCNIICSAWSTEITRTYYLDVIFVIPYRQWTVWIIIFRLCTMPPFHTQMKRTEKRQ